MDTRDPGSEISRVIEGLVLGRVTRRKFVRQATVLGLSAAALGPILEACSNAGQQTSSKPYAGTKVNMVVVSGENDDKGVRDKISEIKSKLGIDLVVTDLEIGAMHDKVLASLRSNTASYDIIDVLGFWVAEMVGPGYFEVLTPYLQNSAKTSANYNFNDFPKGQVDYTGRFDPKTSTFGAGDLYLIPGIHAGSCIQYYRKDLLDSAGLTPPKTLDDYLAVARKLNNASGGIAGNSFVGAVDPSLFLVDWYTRFINLDGKLMSGSPANKTFTPNLDSPESMAALEHLVACKAFAPKGVTQYGFTESVNDMSAGKVGLMMMWSTIAGPMFDPKQSKVSDKVGVAPMPSKSGKAGEAVRGGWGLGIPKNSKVKDAAWQVITYLTSADQDKYQVTHYETDPTRLSTFADPQVVKQLPYMPAAKTAAQNGRILEIAVIPETFQLIDLANRHFNAALNGSETVREASQKAQADWIKALKQAGHLA